MLNLAVREFNIALITSNPPGRAFLTECQAASGKMSFFSYIRCSLHDYYYETETNATVEERNISIELFLTLIGYFNFYLKQTIFL